MPSRADSLRAGWVNSRGRRRGDRSSAHRQVAAGLMIGIMLALLVAQRRGAVLGLFAFAVYGGVLGLGATPRISAWFARHPWLDSLLIVPLAFMLPVLVSSASVGVCALIGLAAGVVFAPLTAHRLRRKRR